MTEKTPLFRRQASTTDQVTDLVESVKAYARQETVEPLKGAARWLAMGTIAAVSLGLAMVFGAMGVLRLSQDLGGTLLDGSWSFLHYFITLIVMSALVWLTFSRISQRSLAKGD
jgi:cytochrome c biogenesis protein CcdA